MTEFKNRVYGCAMVKAINSNYNADFSGQPRTLPNGVVYATDKAFKYAIKNYLKDVFEDKILCFKRFNPKKKDYIPYSLIGAFCEMFPDLAEVKERKKKNSEEENTVDDENEIEDSGNKDKETIKLKANKKQIGQALLRCLDIRLFGITFAAKAAKKIDNVAISIHGPLQINYGINLWKTGGIYTDQIMSPFQNPNEDSGEKQATTLGRQSRLDEGHYIHHFSLNPRNLYEIASCECEKISENDINKLKEAMLRGVTWYDSASKAGCENEVLVWVQLKDNSTIVLPNFTTLIDLLPEKESGKCVYDFINLKDKLNKVAPEVEKIEIFYDKQATIIKNLPEHTVENDL